MPLEMAMLEFDPGGRVSHGNEPYLNFAGPAQVGRELPVGLQPPGKDDSVWRTPFEDAAPLACAAVLADLEPSTSRPWLNDDLDERRRADVMSGRPPCRHVRCEKLECIQWSQL